MTPEALYGSPNALSPHYGHFRVAERLLLTGHSHQAWPDVGLAAHSKAWLDAAELVDEKWDRAFEEARRVRAGYARLLDDRDGHVSLGQNTFELVSRLLSALPLDQRPRVVTTDGEFHTIRRLMDRLMEAGLEVVKVPALPAATLAERMSAALDTRTAAALVSSVLFQNAHRVPHLGVLMDACRTAGAELLVDAYHHLNAVPFSIGGEGLTDAFVVGGGYKYCQLGEGNCFLRVPTGCALRPVLTGWFSEFTALADEKPGAVVYGQDHDRFAGATYDPTSHYRAAAVFDFFEAEGLTPEFLRTVSRHQMALLARLFDDMDVDPALMRRDSSVELDQIGGFLALTTPHAEALQEGLRRAGVFTDHRAGVLRLGPAPYLSDRQLEEAIGALADLLRSM